MASRGEAAPVWVPGAMAATSAERRMKKPADAPREPAGATYTATGARESMMCWMMSRIDVSRPPGVSMVIRTNAAPLPLAWSMPPSTYSAMTGSISPSMRNSTTRDDSPGATVCEGPLLAGSPMAGRRASRSSGLAAIRNA